MFSSQAKAQAYAKVGVETGVNTANPHALILMLFDGALLSIETAKAALDRKQIEQKGQSISKAINIIGNGLRASLDMNVGGELPGRLAALYDYMCDRLLFANLRNDVGVLDEVHGLLKELRDAWAEIKDQV